MRKDKLPKSDPTMNELRINRHYFEGSFSLSARTVFLDRAVDQWIDAAADAVRHQRHRFGPFRGEETRLLRQVAGGEAVGGASEALRAQCSAQPPGAKPCPFQRPPSEPQSNQGAKNVEQLQQCADRHRFHLSERSCCRVHDRNEQQWPQFVGGSLQRRP